MVYLVTNQGELFSDSNYTIISPENALERMKSWKMFQFDTETDGKDAHINDFKCIQFGYDATDERLVVDTSTVDIRIFREFIESHYMIGQNLKFDLQFLYNYGIKPLKVYDTMVVEQFLHLGYPASLCLSSEEYERRHCTYPYHSFYNVDDGITYYRLSFALNAIAGRRLGIDIDKTVRGEIIWRGLDSRVIEYAAGDVTYLQRIMQSQMREVRRIPNAVKGARIECDFTPVIAYLEWCGIKLDEEKWRNKMRNDRERLEKSLKALNDYCISNPKLSRFVDFEPEGDLFSGFRTDPVFGIDWQKDEAKQVFKALGFDIHTISKTTKKDAESVTEKLIASQKGIDDTFLDLYLAYQGYYKVITSFGQGHLNAINPRTGRIHTVYRAIGTVSGRMSSGSEQNNDDLAKFKGFPVNPSGKQRKNGLGCSYPNMQQLPHDAETRACFVAEKGNLFCSCDYSAMEARIGADVYDEHKLLDEFLYGSGDTHAAYAKAVFSKELEGIDTKDVKRLRPDLRSKVKSIEFAVQFGSDGTAVAPQLKISVEEARKLVSNLLDGMSGLKSFKEKGSRFVMEHGYVDILPQTGHRAYWHDWKHWKEVQSTFDSDFWDDYRSNHKGTGDDVCQMVKEHFQAKSKWCDRMSLNLPTQGGGAVCLKEAMINLYRWIMENGYWGRILFCNFTHDECNTEFPEELKDIYPDVVANIMKDACAKYFHKLPIPAVPEVSDHWVH